MRLKWMDYIHEGNSILKTSRHFDIPEATIRYWHNRYNPKNLSSLEEFSRKPKHTRRSLVPENIIERVIELRSRYKGWGKLKIQHLLKNEGINLGQSKIQKIINQAGLRRIVSAKKKYYQRKNRRHIYAVPKEVLKQAGGLVYLDVKHLILPGGLKAYQFTAIDHATRLMKMKIFPKITSLCAKEFLEYLDREYPFDRIQYLGSDNGGEFMGKLDKELHKRNIIHVFSSPRSPRQNPFVERVIRTVIDEVYYYEGLEVNRENQQARLDRFTKDYNEVRPHHSLNLNTPMEQFYMLQYSTPNS
jgi:transposase